MATGGKIPKTGQNLMLDRTYNASPSNSLPNKFRIGVGTTTPVSADTALEKGVPNTSTTTDACDAITGWAHSNDATTEVLNTTSGERKEGTGCLNLPSTFSAGTATWQKTVTGADLSTTGDRVFVYFYISDKATLFTDTTDTVFIRLGTGGMTNYNQYNFDYDVITDADWTLFVLDPNNPDSTGGSGANESDIDTIQINVKAKASMVTNNCRMDWWHYGLNENFQNGFVSGYPTFDTTNKKVTIRGLVPAAKYNDYELTEFGVENTDSTVVLVSHDVYNKILKDSSQQIAYILIHQEVDG